MKFTGSPLTHGYADKMITIDLGSGRVATPRLDPKLRNYFLGGRALGLYLLHRRIAAQTSPRDPENPLIFSPGPLAGIPQFPGTSKCMAISLSPLTGIPGVSNFGGRFGAYLKYAGFDALEITGKSETDIMIVIDGFRHEISITKSPLIDEVFDMEKVIADRFTREGRDRKEIVFLTTGIGAAHTTYGCINSHYFDPTKHVDGVKGLFRTKQAGRTGLGSVMSDKKIRAIVVLAEFPHGENPYGASDWEKVKHAGAKLGKVVREVDPQSLKMYRKGSAGLIAFMNKQEYQSLPVNNYQLGSDPRAEAITGKFYADHLFDHRGMDGCFPGCNLRCTKGGWVTLGFGEHKGRRVWVDGPEYETAAGFGSNIGMWNAEFIMEANWHCDNYGIDTITTAVTIAFLMECFQRGYLTREDTDGLVLTWGDEAAVLGFIRQIARGETEFARVAGRGMLPLVDWIADRYVRGKGKGALSPKPELLRFAMQTKGLPFSLYRTHRSLSMQGSYAAASDIGAHHAAAWLIKVDLLGAFPTLQDKARALITYPRVRLGNDNLGLCKLPWVDVFNPDSEKTTAGDKFINPASQEIYADFYNGMLGTDLTWEQIFAQTDRDINLQRVMNMMVYGAETGKQDWIPERAIGPIDDDLYEAERAYHDEEIRRLPDNSPEEIIGKPTREKRELLMNRRKEQLRDLIQAYYRERGWTPAGIPTPATLKAIGLWDFLTGEARAKIAALTVDYQKKDQQKKLTPRGIVDTFKRTLILTVSVMALTGCNLQYHMLYYPSPHLPSTAELAADHIAFWPSGPASYRGFIGTTEIGNIKGTVVVFHGNAGTAADRAYYVKALSSIGYRVILAEYPGYGQRKGQLGEKSFVNDAQATVRLISEKFGEPLFLLGESLGCAVAAGAATDPSLRIDGILLITPWDTLLAVAKSIFPWFPVALLMKDKYDSIANLKSFRGRIAVVGAERDEILPIRHANALYQSLTGDKKMWTLKGAGHNDWPMAVDVSKWREFMDFIKGDGESS